MFVCARPFFPTELEPFALILFTFHSTMTLTEHLMGSNSSSVLNKWIKFYAIFSHFIKNSVVLIGTRGNETNHSDVVAFTFRYGFVCVRDTIVHIPSRDKRFNNFNFNFYQYTFYDCYLSLFFTFFCFLLIEKITNARICCTFRNACAVNCF